MKKFIVCLYFIMLMFCQTINSYNPKDLVRTVLYKNCPGCDLSFSNLQGYNLDYANLEGANLTGANWSGVFLRNANLKKAILVGANFSNSVSAYADFSGADLTNAKILNAQLTKAKFLNSILNATDFVFAICIETFFMESKMNVVNFGHTNLAKANLANSTGTYLADNDTRFCNTIMPDGKAKTVTELSIYSNQQCESPTEF